MLFKRVWLSAWLSLILLAQPAWAIEKVRIKPRPVEGSGTFSDNEPFKGASDGTQFMAGFGAGLGIISGQPAFDVLGFVAKKIVDRGFVPDINDSVWVELQTGPAITQGVLAIPYSAHLRWDFTRDEQWTFFATGGLGGTVVGISAPSTRVEIFPRFGVGALLHIFPGIALRGDLSHEFTGVGAAFQF